MEFRRPQRDETPNEGLVERHRREIFPLLRQRWRFAGSSHFRQLTAFDSGTEVADVFAYANQAEHGPADAGERRSLVVYLNRYPRAHVRIPGVAEALGLLGGAQDYVLLHDQRSGLQYLRGIGDLRQHGLELSLDGYGCHVFLAFEEVSDAGAAGWGELAMRLGLDGVPDAHAALRRLREEPLRAAVAALFATHLAERAFLAGPEDGSAGEPGVVAAGVPSAAGTPSAAGGPSASDVSPGALEPALLAAFEQLARAAGVDAPIDSIVLETARLADRVRAIRPRLVAQALAGWVFGSAIGLIACAGETERTVAAFDDWEAAAAVDDLAHRGGSGGAQAWRAVELARALLSLPRGALEAAVERPGLPLSWFDRPAVRAASGWNEWQGSTYISQEAWHELVEAIAARDELESQGAVSDRGGSLAAAALQQRAKAVGYRLAGPPEPTSGEPRA
jgi:hypothetical protein